MYCLCFCDLGLKLLASSDSGIVGGVEERGDIQWALGEL